MLYCFSSCIKLDKGLRDLHWGPLDKGWFSQWVYVINLSSELKARVLLPLNENHEGQKRIKHNTTSDNSIFTYIKLNLKFKILAKRLEFKKFQTIWQTIKHKLPKTGSKMPFFPYFYSILMKHPIRYKPII